MIGSEYRRNRRKAAANRAAWRLWHLAAESGGETGAKNPKAAKASAAKAAAMQMAEEPEISK